MPKDSGDSWAQGQRCYFSFSVQGSPGLKEQINPDTGKKELLQQTEPFIRYPIDLPSGSSTTKITQPPTLLSSLNLICTWATTSVEKKDKTIYTAIKIENNAVITVSGSGNNSQCSFIGIVKSINQPNANPSKGSLSILPIYFFSNSFGKNGYIDSWGIDGYGAKCNFEINKDYMSVLSYGLTETTTGNAGISIYYYKDENSEDKESEQDITVLPGAYINDSYYNSTAENVYDPTHTDNGPVEGTDTYNTNFKFQPAFNLNYNGDMDYYPFNDVSISGHVKSIITQFTQSGDILTINYNSDEDEEPNPVSHTQSSSQYIDNIKVNPENDPDTPENEQQSEGSGVSLSYSFSKSDLDKVKQYLEDSITNKDILRFGEITTFNTNQTFQNVGLNYTTHTYTNYVAGDDGVEPINYQYGGTLQTPGMLSYSYKNEQLATTDSVTKTPAEFLPN